MPARGTLLKDLTGRAEIQLPLGEVDSDGLWQHLLAAQ